MSCFDFLALLFFFPWPWIFHPFGSTWMGILDFNYKLCDSHGAHWTYKHQPASHHSFAKSIYSQCTQPRSSKQITLTMAFSLVHLMEGTPDKGQTRIRFKTTVLFTPHLTQMEKELKFTFPLECVFFICIR